MSEGVQPPEELDRRERKIKEKWVSFKKTLRTNRSLDPDHAAEKFREAGAKYDAEMKLIDEARQRMIKKSRS
jgi:hypothetical protein